MAAGNGARSVRQPSPEAREKDVVFIELRSANDNGRNLARDARTFWPLLALVAAVVLIGAYGVIG